MKSPIVFMVAGAVAAALLPGCANMTILRTRELREVQAHVDSLKAEVVAIQQELLKSQKSNNELLRLIRADQQVRFEELGSKIGSLESSISESQERLSQIDQKTAAIKARWDEQARADSLAKALRDSELSKLFQLAHDDFMAQRYDLAIAGFSDFKTQHPKDPLAEEASFWLAECYYAQKKDGDAENAYKAYLREYPQGKRTCAVLHKMGMIYERAKKTKSRDLVWRKLIEECPGTEEAHAVKGKM